MVKTNHETASAIDYIHKIQELTGAIFIKCEKWCKGDLFPTFVFSTAGDDNCGYTIEIYYDDDTGWEITSRNIGFDYEALKNGVVPFLQILNYCQDVIKYEDIRKEFGIKEEKDEWLIL